MSESKSGVRTGEGVRREGGKRQNLKLSESQFKDQKVVSDLERVSEGKAESVRN